MHNNISPIPGNPGVGEIVLVAQDIHKHFGGIRALRGAKISLRAGEIHGLIGENGSGKSTLLNILSGQLTADSGTLELNGVDGIDARALRSNIAFVTQELSLAPDLTVAENILMSHDKPRTWRGIDWRRLNRDAQAALERLDLDIDPLTPVSRLRIDQQQLVEIAKAVELKHPILILDEPTSSLTDDAVASLARTMRRLRDTGTAIVFVSHRLEEFLSLTDHITVLRDGVTVSSLPSHEFTRASLVEDMLGYAVEHYVHDGYTDHIEREAVLTVANVSIPGSVDNASFEVFPGEVVALVGLEGAGRSELLDAVFGSVPMATGSVSIGDTHSIPRSPLDAMNRGIALVPGDRKSDGLMLDMTIEENINIARTSGGWRLRPVRRRQEAQSAAETADALTIQKGSNSRLVGTLSGGNQQKVLLGKWLNTDPTVILMDEPTRGVDVGAKREIHSLITELRDRGLGVVVSSSDLEELLLLGDRFIVMFRGRIMGTVSRADATEARLSHLATGGQ
jgi:ABC-type sugar transport system ATPase subunit